MNHMRFCTYASQTSVKSRRCSQKREFWSSRAMPRRKKRTIWEREDHLKLVKMEEVKESMKASDSMRRNWWRSHHWDIQCYLETMAHCRHSHRVLRRKSVAPEGVGKPSWAYKKFWSAHFIVDLQLQHDSAPCSEPFGSYHIEMTRCLQPLASFECRS